MGDRPKFSLVETRVLCALAALWPNGSHHQLGRRGRNSVGENHTAIDGDLVEGPTIKLRTIIACRFSEDHDAVLCDK